MNNRCCAKNSRTIIPATLLLKGSVWRTFPKKTTSFDSSVAGIFGILTNTGTLIIATNNVVHSIWYLHIESLLCVPSLYQQLLQNSVFSKQQDQLTRVIVAGEICPPGLIEESSENRPQATLFNEYGPTPTDTSDTVFLGTTGYCVDCGDFGLCSNMLVTRTNTGYYRGSVVFVDVCAKWR
jgi:non-ribosomal peptide synthetase component F